MNNFNDLTIKKNRKKIRDLLITSMIILISVLVIGLVLYFIGYVFIRGLPLIDFSFLTTAPNPIEQTIGIFPSIVNTLYIIIFTLLLSTPIGVGSAIYLNEYAKSKRIISVIEFATEVLAGIPSILYGVFGYVFFALLFNFKVSLISGGLTLTIMILPILIRTSQEALKAIPKSYRDGALALGTTKWYMIRTMLIPCAINGILTGIVLAIGRIVSESAALLLVAGGSAMYMPKGSIWQQLNNSGSTLSVELYRYAYSRGDNQTAFKIGSVLLIIVMSLNYIISLITRKREKL